MREESSGRGIKSPSLWRWGQRGREAEAEEQSWSVPFFLHQREQARGGARSYDLVLDNGVPVLVQSHLPTKHEWI